jgi:hypothetical protein
VTEESTRVDGCPSCGELLPHVRALYDQIDILKEQRTDLEGELRVKRAIISRMRKDQSSSQTSHPRNAEAEEVFAYWKSRLMPNAREFSGKRWKAVIARLEAGFDVNELKQAVDGCVARQYVTDRGRDSSGTPAQRNVELELICREESNVRRFISYREEEKRHTGEDSDLIPASRVLAMQSAIERPTILHRLHQLRGWSAEAVLRLGLGLDHKEVIFFARNADGRITGISKYQPNPELRSGPKNRATGSRELFPAPEEINADSVWLVEGEPDAVAVTSMGLPAVAVPGVHTWKAGWAERFEMFERVYVCFDCDDQGREAASIRVQQLGKYTHTIPVDLDPGRDDSYDANDLLLEFGERAASTLSSLASTSTGQVQPFQTRLGEPDPYELVKQRLKDAGCKVSERDHGHATSSCPNHEDKHPSLSVSLGDDGRALLHCHAGCHYQDVAAALGLEPRQLFARAG